MTLSIRLILLLGIFCTIYVLSLEVIPERPEVHFVNSYYVKDGNLNVRKLGRKGAYVVNLNFTLVYEAGNNVTMNIVFYEYLHNEYKRSFVEMHFKVCDLILKDPWIGMALRNAGLTTCPVPAGIYSLSNMSIPHADKFRYAWPFERARVTGVFTNPDTGALLANVSIYITFKQKNRQYKPAK